MNGHATKDAEDKTASARRRIEKLVIPTSANNLTVQPKQSGNHLTPTRIARDYGTSGQPRTWHQQTAKTKSIVCRRTLEHADHKVLSLHSKVSTMTLESFISPRDTAHHTSTDMTATAPSACNEQAPWIVEASSNRHAAILRPVVAQSYSMASDASCVLRSVRGSLATRENGWGATSLTGKMRKVVFRELGEELCSGVPVNIYREVAREMKTLHQVALHFVFVKISQLLRPRGHR
ncbi:hypothetical protein SVAN01_09350 [Stagonosporopsis vannaccii]|nr:hypothetical protein SVAN01_09350 [Stagonosporopsis vannaccii]